MTFFHLKDGNILISSLFGMKNKHWISSQLLEKLKHINNNCSKPVIGINKIVDALNKCFNFRSFKTELTQLTKMFLSLKRLTVILTTFCFVQVSLSDPRLPSFITTIRKCCPPDQILDNRYKCVKVPDQLSPSDKLQFVRAKFWDSFCHDAKCRDLRFKTVGFGGCPLRNRIEVNYIEAFPNGSLLTGNGYDEQLVREPNGCGDLALPANLADPPEGPIYIYCKKGVEPTESPTDHVTKCCPKHQVLNSVDKKCVDMSSVGLASAHPHWPLAPRQIRNPMSGLPNQFFQSIALDDNTKW